MRVTRLLAIGSMVFVTTVALASSPSVVHAQPAAGSSELTDEARALYRKGMERFRAQQYAQARASFMAAYGLVKHWSIAAALGDCELRMGRYRDAAEHLAAARREMAADAAEERRADVERALRDAEQHVAALQIRVDESGADVLVNGELVGKSPVDHVLYAEPGTVVVEARIAGRDPAVAKVDAKAGVVAPVELSMPRVESPAPAPVSNVVAGGQAAPAPRPGEAVNADRESTSTKTLVVGTGLGLTLIAAGVGVVYTVKASSAGDDAEALQARRDAELGPQGCGAPGPAASQLCADLRGSLDDRDSAKGISTVAWAGAGVLLVGTAAAYLLWPGESSEGAVSVIPTVQRGAAAMSVQGRF